LNRFRKFIDPFQQSKIARTTVKEHVVWSLVEIMFTLCSFIPARTKKETKTCCMLIPINQWRNIQKLRDLAIFILLLTLNDDVLLLVLMLCPYPVFATIYFLRKLYLRYNLCFVRVDFYCKDICNPVVGVQAIAFEACFRQFFN
jgi:hypothetical protein